MKTGMVSAVFATLFKFDDRPADFLVRSRLLPHRQSLMNLLKRLCSATKLAQCLSLPVLRERRRIALEIFTLRNTRMFLDRDKLDSTF